MILILKHFIRYFFFIWWNDKICFKNIKIDKISGHFLDLSLSLSHTHFLSPCAVALTLCQFVVFVCSCVCCVFIALHTSMLISHIHDTNGQMNVEFDHNDDWMEWEKVENLTPFFLFLSIFLYICIFSMRIFFHINWIFAFILFCTVSLRWNESNFALSNCEWRIMMERHNEENIWNKKMEVWCTKRAEREQRLAKGMKCEASQIVRKMKMDSRQALQMTKK